MVEAESSVPHVPQAWIGQEVYVVSARGEGPDDLLNCTLQEVNELGIAVVAGEKPSFFPWSSVRRLDLGHEPEPRRTLEVRR
jgi:hypothetical protein